MPIFREIYHFFHNSSESDTTVTHANHDQAPLLPVISQTAVAGVTQDTVHDDAIVNTTSVPAAHSAELAKSTKHLLQYPVAKSAIETVQSVNYPRLVSPYLVEARKSSVVKPIFDAVDNFNDGVLDQVDRIVPQLRTTEPADLAAPLTSARESTTRLTHATEELINERLVTPARKAVADFRERYSTALVDTNGRALIRSQADPVVKPINERMEKFIDEHLAEGDSVPTEGFSNELSRSGRIVLNGAQRAAPVVRAAPTTVTEHATTIYNLKKAETGDSVLGSFRATMQTASVLTWEAFQPLCRFLGWGPREEMH